ncbi:hypothetical protein C8J56DRAFT_106117 [Mycena floridula]|nr:hypothetical protein C8J56DRAFT_106117 [Mycena floridula]
MEEYCWCVSFLRFLSSSFAIGPSAHVIHRLLPRGRTHVIPIWGFILEEEFGEAAKVSLFFFSFLLRFAHPARFTLLESICRFGRCLLQHRWPLELSPSPLLSKQILNIGLVALLMSFIHDLKQIRALLDYRQSSKRAHRRLSRHSEE